MFKKIAEPANNGIIPTDGVLCLCHINDIQNLPCPIVTWLEEHSTITVKNDLTAALTAVNVSTVLELAALSEKGLLQVSQAMKKNNQKKWETSRISEQLRLHAKQHVDKLAKAKKDALAKLAKEERDAVVSASAATTVGKWLHALALTGNGAKDWLENYGCGQGKMIYLYSHYTYVS